MTSQLTQGENNTFYWRLDKFTVSSCYVSSMFQANGHGYGVSAKYFSFGPIEEPFWIFSLSSWTYNVFPIYCEMCVMNNSGQKCFGTKKKVDGSSLEGRIIAIFSQDHLRGLIHRDTVTLRFTIIEERDALRLKLCLQCGGRKPDLLRESSSDVLVDATKTETPHPVATENKGVNTDEGPNKLLEILSDDFVKFYTSKTDTDCVLQLKDAQIPAHRAVLSARSPVFSAMFHHDTSENRSGEVVISDVECTYVNDVLYYIYSGKIRGLTANSATSLYTVADKYALIEMRNECLDFLKRSLTMDNICDAAVLAHAHGETELEEIVIRFIKDKFDELVKNENWNQFLSVNPSFASKLLSSALLLARIKE